MRESAPAEKIRMFQPHLAPAHAVRDSTNRERLAALAVALKRSPHLGHFIVSKSTRRISAGGIE